MIGRRSIICLIGVCIVIGFVSQAQISQKNEISPLYEYRTAQVAEELGLAAAGSANSDVELGSVTAAGLTVQTTKAGLAVQTKQAIGQTMWPSPYICRSPMVSGGCTHPYPRFTTWLGCIPSPTSFCRS